MKRKAAPTAAPKKNIGGRRGRTKQFEADKIQADYERQRELKAHYNELLMQLFRVREYESTRSFLDPINRNN